MNKQVSWSLGLGAVLLSGWGLYSLSIAPSQNEKAIGKISNIETYSLNEFVKGIEWGNTQRNKKYLRNITFADEQTYQDVRKELLIPFEKELFKTGKKHLNQFFGHQEKTIFGIDAIPTELLDEKDGIKRFSWKTNFPNSANEWSFTQYANMFHQVDDFRFDVKNYYIEMSDRRPEDSKFTKIKLTGFFDLRGTTTEKERRHDIGQVNMLVDQVEGKWKITEMFFHKFTTTTAKRDPAFTDMTSKSFAQGGPSVHLRREAIRRGGYALSTTDVNNDGFLDLYIGSAAESEMWIFDPAIKKYSRKMQDSFADEKMVKTAVFADFDNDQYEDLFVTSFNPFAGEGKSFDELVLYKNDKGVFKKVSDDQGVKKDSSFYPMPAVVGDFNNDGRNDIYVGFPGKKDFTFTNVSGHEVVGGNKDVQGLFLNKGDMNFSKTDLFIADMSQGHRQYLYPHSALAIDWNKDHNMDIVVIDDQMNLSPFYLNKGDATFEQVAEKIGMGDTSNAMSIAAGDFNNDGLIDFAMSAVNIDAALRNENAMANLWHREEERFISGIGGAGVRLFQQTKNGTFLEVTQDAGLSHVGQGVAGIEFIDYNNDGYIDLYVTNGLWSGNDRYQEADHLLAEYKIKNPRSDAILKDNARVNTNTTVSDFMSFLIDFRGDLFAPKYTGNKSVSVAGYQRNRLFRNNGDNTFTDVSYMEGVDSIYDGYVVAAADLDKDGKTDLILRNGDPGQQEYTFPAVEIFHNTMNWEGKSIDLALKNSKSSDAYGVGVTVEYAGMKQYKQLVSNNGAAQGERILHFGIGNRNSVEKITIHWNSGDKVYHGIKAGKHEFSEITNILSQK